MNVYKLQYSILLRFSSVFVQHVYGYDDRTRPRYHHEKSAFFTSSSSFTNNAYYLNKKTSNIQNNRKFNHRWPVLNFPNHRRLRLRRRVCSYFQEVENDVNNNITYHLMVYRFLPHLIVWNVAVAVR